MSKILIETAGTEFEQNGKPYAVIDENFREGKPIMLDAADVAVVVAAFEDETQSTSGDTTPETNGEDNSGETNPETPEDTTNGEG